MNLKVIEVKTPVSKKDYENLLNHADTKTLPVFKTRRVFMHKNQQYQLDIYRSVLNEINSSNAKHESNFPGTPVMTVATVS